MSQVKLNRRVVITGYGMITPLGRNSRETFENAAAGRSGIDYLSSFDTRGLPCRIGGQVNDQWMDVPSGRKLRGIEKYSSRGFKLMRIATAEASDRARLEEIVDRGKIGVALGFHAENPSVEDMLFLHRFYDGAGNWDMEGLSKAGGYSFFNFFRRKPDVATSLLSLLYDCHGSSITTVSACAAGNQAIGEAYRLIKSGRCDAMIAGGCEASLTFSGFVGFVLIRALTEKYSSPQKASRPFDRKRNGFVMSEGAGAVILENLEHAVSRKAPIFGELLGYGSSADAYRITDTHPTGEGAALAMKQAIADASLTPDDVDYINAHGTSTIQNDLTETVAIRKVFGERAKRIPVSSNKSMMGHTIAAAGAIECILTIMGMNKATILPTINYDTRDPKCDLDYVPNEARIQEHAVSLCNSFGFGGQNGTLCLRRYDG